MPAFSDRAIRALPVTGQNYRRYEGGSDSGFGIQVTAQGTKTFFFQYTLESKRRFLRLGTYPDTTLAEARQRARAARALVDQDVDPQQAAQHRAQAKRLGGTVEQLKEAYIAHLELRERRSAGEVRRCLEKDAIPHIGALPAKEVEPGHIRDILFRLISRGADTGSNRLRSYLHGMFVFGIHHDNDPRSVGAPVLFGIKHNPVEAVPRDASAESADDRALSWDEIRQVWHAPELALPHRLAVRLLLATGGQRSGEVTRAPWAEFDLNSSVWWLPAARAKNKRDHGIPLAPLAVEILADIRAVSPGSVWLFPARHNPAAAKPWNEGTLAHAIQDYCRVSGMLPWAPKDIRRTAKTRMGEIGISKIYRDLVQNHTLNASHYPQVAEGP